MHANLHHIKHVFLLNSHAHFQAISEDKAHVLANNI
jgi:hypothetical protein